MISTITKGLRVLGTVILYTVALGFIAPTILGAFYMGTFFGQVGLNLLFTVGY